MKKVILISSILLAVLTSCDKDDDDDNNSLNDTDQMFITQVAIGNTAEVSAGQMAATKGEHGAVKDFGQMMVGEHGLAQTELKSLGASLQVAVPDSLDPEHQMLAQRLDTLNGIAFDTAYINSQVRDHQKTLNIFQMEISSGSHQRIRDYANKYLPHIQMHLNKADSIRQIL